jgi:hypothetical protein
MSTSAVGTSGKDSRVGKSGEGGIEPSDESMDLIVVAHFQTVLGGEVHIFLSASNEVNIEDFARVGHDHVLVHVVNEGFLHDGGSHDTHINSIDILPEILLLGFKVTIFNGGDEDGAAVGKHLSVLFAEVFITSPENTVKHALVKEHVSHPL